jgi:hypothetical protein
MMDAREDAKKLGSGRQDGLKRRQEGKTAPLPSTHLLHERSRTAHIYWALSPGIARANLDGTGVNEGLISAPPIVSGVAVDALFSNEFGFGKVKKDERKGTAKLTVKVPGPGDFELRGKGIKTASKDVPHAGKVKLAVKPTGTAKQKLNQTGEAKVRAAVTYTPDGGIPDAPNTERKKIKLVKR